MQGLNRVLGLKRDKEVKGYHLGALVDELVECVLTTGSWLSPHARGNLVVQMDTYLDDVLPTGLYVTLLEVNRKTVQVLVTGWQDLCLTPKAVDVPDPQQCQEDRGVLF